MTVSDDLKTALQTIPILATQPLSAWHVDRLGGVTNRNYRVHLRAGDEAVRGGEKAGDFVLRLPGAGTSSYLNRPAGLYNAKLAAGIGLAPAVLFSDAKHGWQLSRYLSDARSLTSQDLGDPVTRSAVAHLIGRLQRDAAPFQHEMRPFEISDRYLALAPEPVLLALRQQAKHIEAEIEEPNLALVPAHIDPNPTNFLRLPDNTLYLIDWEFSAMADPCWDLAAIATEGQMTMQEIDAFLTAAGHVADAQMKRRIALFQCALALVASSWAYVEIAAGNDSEDLRRFAEARREAFAQRLSVI